VKLVRPQTVKRAPSAGSAWGIWNSAVKAEVALHASFHEPLPSDHFRLKLGSNALPLHGERRSHADLHARDVTSMCVGLTGRVALFVLLILFAWLQDTTIACVDLFRGGGAALSLSPPPRTPPPEFGVVYGRSQVQDYFVDDSGGPGGFHFKWEVSDFSDLMSRANVSFDSRAPAFRRLRDTDQWLQRAMSVYGCVAHDTPSQVLVIGPGPEPWHEAWLLNACPFVSNIHSVDPRRLTVQHARVHTFTVEEWVRDMAQGLPQYDFALAILSVEHAGLGYTQCS
jgi:hypothetical protein